VRHAIVLAAALALIAAAPDWAGQLQAVTDSLEAGDPARAQRQAAPLLRPDVPARPRVLGRCLLIESQISQGRRTSPAPCLAALEEIGAERSERAILALALSDRRADARDSLRRQRVSEIVWAIDPDAGVSHRATTTLWPLRLAGFRRTQVQALGFDGADVSLGYIGLAPRIELSLYLTRTGTAVPLEDAITISRDLLRQTTTLTSETAAEPFADAPGRVTRRLRFAVTQPGGRADIIGLWVAQSGDWRLKVSARWPASQDQAARAAMARFVAALPWPAPGDPL
jgi:hypothetical protein